MEASGEGAIVKGSDVVLLQDAPQLGFSLSSFGENGGRSSIVSEISISILLPSDFGDRGVVAILTHSDGG